MLLTYAEKVKNESESPKEDLKEDLHIQYIAEKLAQAENIAADPDKWMTLGELYDEWDT
jgi:hypothetical protein